MKFPNLTPEIISQKIIGQNDLEPFNEYPDHLKFSDLKKAAVLLPLFKKKDEWHLLFIRRAEIAGDLHSGQVAFPGGAMEENDLNLEETAKRETCEEIGLAPDKVNVVGRLQDHITISGFTVTPIVAVIPDSNEFILSEDEVRRVFSIPLSWLADEDNCYIKKRDLPDGSFVNVRYYKEYGGEILWGASARITLAFFSNLLD
jgi:8-oxo-dGTP pyrophosphatase MutT (NUDIX family)